MRSYVALVAALAPDEPALGSEGRDEACRAAADFLRRQLDIAPLHLRAGVASLAFVFFAAALVAGAGRPFASRDLAWRRAFVERVSRASMAGAMLVRLYRSLALLAYLEHPLVRAALGADGVAERIAERRAMRLERITQGGS